MTEPRHRAGAMAALLVCFALAAPVAAQQAVAPADATQPADAQALFDQGLRHHEGSGVPQNFAAAAELFAAAAAQGHAGAQNFLGRYHHAGFGVDRDQTQALKWLAAAAQSGEPQYIFDLGQALENGADGSSDPARAAEFYQAAANLGHLPAKTSLGVLYQNGAGLAQDFARARALYTEAAEAGDARALNNLGLLFVRGNGVPQDYARAAELFAQAAEMGMAEAMTNLGVMYENGFGVPLDEARAAELYRLGGQTGRSDGSGEALTGLIYDDRLAAPPSPADTDADAAKFALDRLAEQARAGDPVALFQLGWLMASPEDAAHPALAQAALLFAAAADKGHGPSMVNLGLMHFQGRGVLQDYVAGQMWLTLAEAAGQKGAADLGLRFADVMTPEQINQAQALAAARLAR